MTIRIFGRPAAALSACALALVGAGTAPAADSVTLRIEAPAKYVMYNADEGADGENREFTVPVGVRGGGTPARNLEVVVDASALAGTARPDAAGGWGCQGRGMVFTCNYGSPDEGESVVPFALYGVAGVKPGDGGTITYTVTADNAPTVTGSTRMLVGGPTLLTSKDGSMTGVEPEKPAKVTPAFANHTRFTATEGVGLTITSEDGLTLARRYSNCYYRGSSAHSAWCEFRTAVEPGKAYRTSAPFTFTAGRTQLTGSLRYSASSSVDRPAEYTLPGKGAPLTLTRTAGRGFEEFGGGIAVRTTQQADYRPVTGTVKGRVGDTVEVSLGVHNAGPGDPTDAGVGRFEVIPPEGTTVTSIPYVFEDLTPKWACERPGKPAKAYVCDLSQDGFAFGSVGPGRSNTIAFRIRIDKQVPGAQGTIRAYGPFDRTHANDTAAIPLQASPAPAWAWLLRPATVITALGALTAGTLVAVFRRRRAAARP